MAPQGNCLQYHTASSGTFASFAWDLSTYGPGVTGTTGIAQYTQFHLANQHYNVCFRREQGKTAVCYTPKILGHTTIGGIASSASFGLGGDAVSAPGAAAVQQTDGIKMAASTATVTDGTSACQGYTVFNSAAAAIGGTDDVARTTGDYLEIPQAYDHVAFAALSTTIQAKAGQQSSITRVCGNVFAATPVASTAPTGTAATQAIPLTICSKTTPFRIGVHTDSTENMGLVASTAAQKAATAANWDNWEAGTRAANDGLGYSGFYLEYFQQ